MAAVRSQGLHCISQLDWRDSKASIVFVEQSFPLVACLLETWMSSSKVPRRGPLDILSVPMNAATVFCVSVHCCA